jgi:hypothetical protein
VVAAAGAGGPVGGGEQRAGLVVGEEGDDGLVAALERHLGDGVIEAIVDEAVAAGRLRPRQRRRLT